MSGHAFRKITGMRYTMGGLWYQFITTGGPLTTDGDRYYQGSAVAVKLPKIPETGTLSFDDLEPIATGSTIENLPDGTTPDESVMSTISRVKCPIQVELITEPCCYIFQSLDNYKKYQQLMYSWCGRPGQIQNAGALSPTPWFGYRDVGYDARPTPIKGRNNTSRSPDTDWPHDAMLVKINSEEFGSRSFIVMVDASQRFYCWPHVYDQDDEGLSVSYPEQGQTVNVSSDQVQSLIPPFPEWVYVPVGQRRDTDWPSTNDSGEPRYVWRFHPLGTKVVGLVLQREPFSGELWSTNVNYTSGDPHYENTSSVVEDWEFSTETIHGIDYSGVPQNDSPGYVEFSVDIAITGTLDTDFTFGLTLIDHQPTDEDHYIVAADYLSPIINGWDSYSVDAQPGDLIVLDLEVRIGPLNMELLESEGFLDTHTEYFRQVWASVIHNETGTVLRKFLLLEKPDDYLYTGTYVDSPEQYIISGALSGIDLSKLSFSYQARRQKFFMDDEDYYTENYDTFFGYWFGVRQRWMREEAGIRLYVFNQLVKEVRGGESYDLWDSVDSTSVDSTSSRLSPLAVGEKHIKNSPGNIANNLRVYLSLIPFAYYTTEVFIAPSIYTLTEYQLLDPEDPDDVEYAVYNGFYSTIIGNADGTNDKNLQKSEIIEQLQYIDEKFDETYIEEHIYPYVKSYLERVLAQIDHIEIVGDPEIPGRMIPSIVWNPGYGSASCIMGFTDPNDRSFSHFTNYYFLHYRAYKKSSYIQGFSYTLPPEHLYGVPTLRDYPVGKDSYLFAWFNSIKLSVNETVYVSPEGFYGATHELFYAAEDLPDASIYTVGEFTDAFINDRYFVDRGYGRSPDPVAIIKNQRFTFES